MWTVLADLAGRAPDHDPARDASLPLEWRISEPWLEPWGNTSTLYVHATRTRLTVTHEAGFAVFNVARASSRTPLAQARTLCDKCPAFKGVELSRGTSHHRAAHGNTGRWMSHLLAYLDARLAIALGVASPKELLCRHDAMIVASTSSVDIHLSLADLPLPIRFAGLDRDTGWIPAAGRSMSFHFT